MDRIGKYILQGELGKGAMGVVYKGLDPYIERPVAVKTIRFELLSDPAEQEQAQIRFMREARSAGKLSHPNIVTIYEVGEDLGQTFIAMEYVDGQSLEKLLASGKRFGFDEITSLVARVGGALDYAHGKGVIHRDIKPANILIDREGAPHIVDFGIARLAASSTLTLTRTVIGTPFYMSPEQIAGKKIDHRTDIFSLGTILYELVTGNKPFPGESLTTIIYKIMNETPPPVTTCTKGLPEGIDRIVGRAIAKSPEARYQRCADLARDLSRLTESRPLAERAFLRTEPEPVSTAGADHRADARPKRRRALLLVVAGMMAVVAAIVLALYYYSSRGELPRLLGGRGAPPPAVVSPPQPVPGEETPVRRETQLPSAEPELESPVENPQRTEAGLPETDRPLAAKETPMAEAAAETPRSETAAPQKPPLQKEEVKPPQTPTPKPAAKEPAVPEPAKRKATEEKAEVEQKVVPETEAQAAPVERETIDLEKIYEEGMDALREGRYEDAVRSMESLLREQPNHRNAQYYLAIARKRMEDEEKKRIAEAQRASALARHLKAAEESLSAGDAERALAESREALGLDPDNAAAKEYAQLAALKLARGEIKQAVDAYVRSIADRSLIAFYQAYCSADLFQAISKDAGVTLKLYENLQALASQVEMDINPASDGRLVAEVRFTQIMTGVSTARRIREVLFEGKIGWKMERTDGKWKILNITFQTADRKTPEKEAS